MKALEKLMLTIGMRDDTSKGMASINKSIEKMKANANGGATAIKNGAMGLLASGLGIKTFMQPVYEMQAALGDVRAFDVSERALQRLQDQALSFSKTYGGSAAEIVRSGANVASSFSDLSEYELLKLTDTTNLLAKATKGSTEATTAYLSRMFSTYESTIEGMSRSQWLQQLADQTAYSTKLFRTSGADMNAAFEAIGGLGVRSGRGLEEQMAVLGVLQREMSGGAAGGAYKSFLEDVGKSQETLGMRFTDSQGKLLPMIDILTKLRSRYGDTLNVMQQKQLADGFGKEGAKMLQILLKNTDQFTKGLNDLQKNKGMKHAAKMAEAMADPWEKFTAQVNAVRIGIGNSLLPVVNDFLGIMGNGLNTLSGWTKEFPHLTKAVGFLTLGLLLLGATTSLLTLIFGVVKMAMVALTAVFFALSIAGKALAFAFFLVTSPIGLIVLGIAAVVAVVALAIMYWDELTAWFSNIQWADIAVNALKLVLNSLLFIPTTIFKVIKAIGDFFGVWDYLKNLMSNVPWLQTIMDLFGGLGDQILRFLRWVGLVDETSVEVATKAVTELEVSGRVDTSLPSASDSIAAVSKSGSSFGDVHIISQSPMRPSDMEAWALTQGG